MGRHSRRLLVFLAICFAVYTAFFAIAPAQAAPSTDRTINFSARLRNASGVAAPDGYYNIGFRLYDTSESGAPIWAETYFDENGSAPGQDFRVKVVNGYFTVQLGARTPFGSSVNWDGSLWLTMNIGGTEQTGAIDAIAWDGEMAPRIQLGAVPYAMNAGALGGKTASDFIQLGQGTQTNSSDNPSISINTTGHGDLIQLQHDAKDVFTIDSGGNIVFGSGKNHTISIDQAAENTDGSTLVVSGGDGGEGTSNGGNLVLSGGSGSGGGADGLVILATATFATATDDTNCYTGGMVVSSSCTIAQSTVDRSSAAVIGFSTAKQTATLPDPTIATPGRILYIMAANDSLPFSLSINGGEILSLQAKTALTMLWNGSDWVVASHNGAPSSAPPEPAIPEKSSDAPLVIEEKVDDKTTEIQNAGPVTTDSTPTDQEDATFLPFQLGQLETAPPATPGSMYYDSTLGKVRCYEASGWGACGDAPDTFVSISPEYKNAVMNGTDIGIISSDFCSDTLDINDGTKEQPTVCGTNETYNFYNWTTEEESDQTRSIYLTYQLPDNFKGFVPESTAIMGRTDSDDATVSYQIYRDNGEGLLSCGDTVAVSTGQQSTWQRGLASGKSDPPECDFEAGDSILFRINLTARDQANAYVSNINFIFRNNN